MRLGIGGPRCLVTLLSAAFFAVFKRSDVLCATADFLVATSMLKNTHDVEERMNCRVNFVKIKYIVPIDTEKYD